MGILGSIKDRIDSQRAFGRASEKANIAVDVDRPKEKKNDGDDTLFESAKEKQERLETKRIDREIAGIERRQKIRKGEGVLGKLSKGMERFSESESPQRSKRRGSGIDVDEIVFGSKRGRQSNSGFNIDNLVGFGSPRAPTSNKPRRREVPIYGKGGRIVGYRSVKSKGSSKRRSNNSPDMGSFFHSL